MPPCRWSPGGEWSAYRGMSWVCTILTMPRYDVQKNPVPDELSQATARRCGNRGTSEASAKSGGCQIGWRQLTMLLNLGHERSEVRTYTFLRNVCGKGAASALRRGFRAPSPTTRSVPAPRPSPTLRGLDARQGLPALVLSSEGPCPSETSRVRASAPRHPHSASIRSTRPSVSPLDHCPPRGEIWLIIASTLR